VSGALELRLANDVAAMAGLAEAVERFGSAHRLPADILNALRVAVDEIVTNAVTHGYPPGVHGKIAVRLRHRPGSIQRNADRVRSMRRGDRVVLEFHFQH
jgi:anti-sigma regulatory factor (Ser/Thr protein kinase)